MSVRELNTDLELFTIERPCALQTGPLKCCCYQKASIFSSGTLLGTIEEQMYCCIPSFLVRDEIKRKMYKIHPPTCCFGCCMNCCTGDADGLSGCCCKVPFWIFPARQKYTDGRNAQHVGTIVKQMKSTLTDVFTESDAFEVVFPEYATTEQKALLSGSAIFFNAIFFEGD
jgi:Scramblase